MAIGSGLGRIRHTGLCGPLLILAVASSLLIHVRYLSSLPTPANGNPGPASWPGVMFFGLTISAAVFCGYRLRECLRSGSGTNAQAPACDNLRLYLGLCLIIAYGAGITYIGFAFATLIFLAGWFVLGGTRRPLTVAVVALLGTAAPLYLFLTVAYLPLPRGSGAFDALTVQLYRLLGIY